MQYVVDLGSTLSRGPFVVHNTNYGSVPTRARGRGRYLTTLVYYPCPGELIETCVSPLPRDTKFLPHMKEALHGFIGIHQLLHYSW